MPYFLPLIDSINLVPVNFVSMPFAETLYVKTLAVASFPNMPNKTFNFISPLTLSSPSTISLVILIGLPSYVIFIGNLLKYSS